MSERRVVVTGLGAVTPLGQTKNREGKNEFWENMVAGKSAISNIKSLKGANIFDRIKGAEIRGFDITHYFNPSEINEKKLKRIRGLDNAIQYALAATKLTLEDSSLLNRTNDIGFYTGNAMQCIGTMEKMIVEYIQKYALQFGELLSSDVSMFSDVSLHSANHNFNITTLEEVLKSKINKLKKDGIYDFEDINVFALFKTVSPTIFNFINYAISGQVAEFFNFHGPTLAFNSACSAGSDAVGQAYRAIKDNDTEVIVSGGTEAPIAYCILSMFNKLKIMSKNGVKPGDLERDGFALGEGAGYLVLEELGHAISRKAKIYSEIVSYAQSNDAYGMIALEPEGRFIEETIYRALKKANLSPADIDYINPHGTSTMDCDLIESKVFKRVFKDNLENLLVHPSKSATGHFQAGAGAVEAILINLIFEKDFVPGTQNQHNPDPSCIAYTPKEGVQRRVNVALSSSMGFGGHNSILIFKRYR